MVVLPTKLTVVQQVVHFQKCPLAGLVRDLARRHEEMQPNRLGVGNCCTRGSRHIDASLEKMTLGTRMVPQMGGAIGNPLAAARRLGLDKDPARETMCLYLKFWRRSSSSYWAGRQHVMASPNLSRAADDDFDIGLVAQHAVVHGRGHP